MSKLGGFFVRSLIANIKKVNADYLRTDANEVSSCKPEVSSSAYHNTSRPKRCCVTVDFWSIVHESALPFAVSDRNSGHAITCETREHLGRGDLIYIRSKVRKRVQEEKAISLRGYLEDRSGVCNDDGLCSPTPMAFGLD